MKLENLKDKVWKRLLIILMSPILLPIALCLIFIFIIFHEPFMWLKTGKSTMIDV